ncbi:MAG: UDP-glucose 6-dehydrogenase [Chloroflexi bacterium]|nr:UDP-glucose 6-dehydrogenase [Chloroflexota bacterium]
MKIVVFGAGYVGLVTSTCLAEMGNTVTCIDIDKDKIRDLNNSNIPVFEPGLLELLSSNLNNRLFFASDFKSSLIDCDIIFIAVGTPEDKDGNPILDNLLAVAENIGSNINDKCIIVQKSTAPVGTCHQIKSIIDNKLKSRDLSFDVDVVSNPEFLKEGNAVNDFMSPDRVVIGSENEYATKIMKELYKPFTLNHERFLVMDIKSSEMTKYAANAMLASKISFINEIANIAKTLGADINQIRLGIGSDKRIGYDFIYPGIGYGGSCFPKDLNALVKMGESIDYNPTLIKSISKVNLYQKQKFADDVISRFSNKNESLENIKIAIWGLTFKPETDDMRNAPSIYIINRLLEKGADVLACDPRASEANLSKFFNCDEFSILNNQYDVLENADCLLLLTEWREFRSPDFNKVKSLMKNPIIFDGRNLYNKLELEDIGFEIHQI